MKKAQLLQTVLLLRGILGPQSSVDSILRILKYASADGGKMDGGHSRVS